MFFLLVLGSCTKNYSIGPIVWTPTPTVSSHIPATATFTITATPTAIATTTSTVTTTPTVTLTATSTPLGSCFLVDNFDDGDLTDAFGYGWTAAAWGSGTVNGPEVSASGAFSGISLDWSGTYPTSTGTDGFLCQALLGDSDLSPYFKGLSFYIMTSAPATLRVQIQSGGTSASSAPYGCTFTTTTGWTLVTVPLSSWTTEYGVESIPLETCLSDVYSLQWLSAGDAQPTLLGVSLDDVCINTTP